MKRMILAVLGAALAIGCFAADNVLVYVPNTTTTVAPYTVKIKTLYLANKTAGSVTVTLKDRSTNCNSAACQFWPAITMAANSTYVVDMRGIRVTSGFTWESDTANAVVGWVEYQ